MREGVWPLGVSWGWLLGDPDSLASHRYTSPSANLSILTCHCPFPQTAPCLPPSLLQVGLW